MAMGPRLRQGDVPLRTFRCGITVPPATLHGTTEGLSTALPPSSPDPALPLQDNRTGQVQDISAGRTRPSTHENGATTAPAAAQPEPEIWNWMQRVGGVLGILGTFVAIIYFVFPYRAAITANQLATNGIALANVANGWTRWAQCTAPGSMIANATWCRNHPTPDTFDKDFNNVRRSLSDVVSSGIFGSGFIAEIHNIRLLSWVLIPSIGVLLFLLRKRSTGREPMPLWLAAEKGRKAVVKKLLKKGENPNSFDGKGQTALWSAVMGGHEAIVKMLLEKGAKTEVTDLRGRTPLRMASGLGHEGIAMLLLKHGADPYSTKEYKRHLVMVVNIVRAKRAAERLYDHEGKFTR